MTTTAHETRDIRPGRQRVSLAIATSLSIQGQVRTLMRDGLRTNDAEMTRRAA